MVWKLKVLHCVAGHGRNDTLKRRGHANLMLIWWLVENWNEFVRLLLKHATLRRVYEIWLLDALLNSAIVVVVGESKSLPNHLRDCKHNLLSRSDGLD